MEAKTIKVKAGETLVRLRIVVIDPPDPITSDAEMGLQDKKGVVYEVEVDERGDAIYDLETRAKWENERKIPNFLCDWIAGPITERFLYVSWNRLVPGAGGRRMKVH
ncbi:MAG: DUF5990 family protein [Candidatus Poribacteria bacterium]|nr:DUF5990 family protein [Candidatus Poribacteria bacterium]